MLVCALVLLGGCGRYFGGVIQPLPESEQSGHMVVQDDRSVTYVYERLEIGLLPMTDGELNRQFPGIFIDFFDFHNWKCVSDLEPWSRNQGPPQRRVNAGIWKAGFRKIR